MNKRFKTINVSILILLIVPFISCNTMKFDKKIKDQLEELYSRGEFEKVDSILKSVETEDDEVAYYADSLRDYMHRFELEYPLTPAQVKDAIEQKGVSCNSALIEQWEQKGMLEYKWIDGRKKYFKNAVYNLFLLNDSLRAVSGQKGLNDDGLGEVCVDHIKDVLGSYSGEADGKPVCPIPMKLSYTIAVKQGAVPAGEEISAWLPYGVRDISRQTDVRLIESHPASPLISSNDCQHQSLFLKQKMSSESETVFSARTGITGHATYFSPDLLSEIKFGAIPDSVQKYLGEREPHILFSERIRHLADSLTHPDMRPYEMVRAFYYWINDHIPWASAIEYGLIANIPQYTLDHMHGDCGMQTLLFITLCRYKGIPARWQSGWMLHPGHVNLHDWCEVWYPKVGWVPVDVSFKLQKSPNLRIREFYISGIDAYRFIVNTDYGKGFCPPKTWPRSEPWDFQRGEVEWAKGNLYFNQWTRKMQVEYSGNAEKRIFH
jgi:hypothetical protein